MERWIDINADVGEVPEALADGSEEKLIACITSANIACGGHAGTPETMAAVMALADRYGVCIGAHPGYPDPAHFGREEMELTSGEIEDTVAQQVRALLDIAARHGYSVRHVKPHGALYNVAVREPRVARAIATGLSTWRDELLLVGLAGSAMLRLWQEEGFRVAAEAFADRRYEPDGTLRARRHADALILDPDAAAAQAVEIAINRRVMSVSGSPVPVEAQTLCVHGDTPNAPAIAAAVRRELEGRGFQLRAAG
ncbi:MAG TPA: 5-oxoprolinase subunit PxpA [Candidatus Krumholzibacteria bacterium]|jgi:5-oxoprolinase (ATP-hydrolysing) subunit A|nr:5-oxoprolinase subunit PxpA [Candidatus Krumholzibacteria bacterium]